MKSPQVVEARVGHQVSQQLSLLITGLKDRSNRLSQGRRRRWVPVWVSGLGITLPLLVFTILPFKQVAISSKIETQ
jgi:hypothetical protein